MPVRIRAAFISGTVLSLAAVSAWSWSATVTVGPAGPVHLDRDLPADYAALAAAATGNGLALFAVTAGIYSACFFVSGLRAISRAQREASREPGYRAGDMEAAPVSGRWS